MSTPNLASAIARLAVVGLAAASCPADGGVGVQLIVGASGNALWELATKIPGLGSLFSRKITEPNHWFAAAFSRALKKAAEDTAKGKCLAAFETTAFWKNDATSDERRAIEDFYNALRHTDDHAIAAGLAAGFTDSDFLAVLSDKTGEVSAQLIDTLRDTALAGCPPKFQDWFIGWMREYFQRLFVDEVLTDPTSAARWQSLLLEHISAQLGVLDGNDKSILTLLRSVHKHILAARPTDFPGVDAAAIAREMKKTFGDLLNDIAIDAEGARIAAESADSGIAIVDAKVDRILANQSAPLPTKIPWKLPTAAELIIGRDEAIPEVAALIAKHRIVFITGAGGLGKTALAAAAIEHVAGTQEAPRTFTGGILFHDYYASRSHIAAIDSILAQTGHSEVKENREALAAAELSVPHRLLYLEGCEQAEDLPALLAIAGGIRIVATSRNTYQSQDGFGYELQPISDKKAAELIQHHRKHGTAADCADLAKMLGGHALACVRAGIQIHLGPHTVATMIAKLRSLGLPAIHPRKTGPAERDHEHRAVGHLIAMDATAVATQNPHALRVWSLLAFGALAPLPIDPLPVREKRPEIADDTPELRPPIIPHCLGITDDEADLALEALRTRSLACVEQICASHDGHSERHARLAHALLSEHARPFDTLLPYTFPLDKTEPIAIAKRAVNWWGRTLNAWNKNRTTPGGHVRIALLTPQLDLLPQRAQAAVAEGKSDAVLEDADVIFLIAALGLFDAYAGQYGKALVWKERALEARERTLGREHPDTLISVNSLGYLYVSLGNFAAAQPLYERALEAQERTLGREHTDTLISVNNLADLYRSIGNFAKALPLCERALEVRKRTLGSEHPHTLTSMSNLAGLYFRLGDLVKALPLYEAELEACERTQGREHPETLISVNNLAGLYDNIGEYGKAQALYERSLEAFERTQGREHPDTLTSLNNLAGFYYKRGSVAEAAVLMRRALAGREKVLGPTHPKTVSSRKWLETILAALPGSGGA
jgi:tetratricopeptide (TPR) repeat protein